MQINLRLPERIEGETLAIVHIDEEQGAELIDGTDIILLDGYAAIFDATAFTVYAVVGTEGLPPTLTYRFFASEEDGTPVAEQMVKQGDTLYAPETPEAPTENAVFAGWFEKNTDTAFTGFGTVGAVEADATVELYARFTDAVYVFYMDQDGNIVFTDKAVPNGTVEVVRDFPLIETNSLTSCHVGWAESADSDTDVSGSYPLGTENVTLWPIVKEGFWVRFESNGGTAYVDQFVPLDAAEKKAANPGNPYKDGYSFTGWYADEGCTQLYDFSAEVTGDLQLYAGYKANEDALYNVNYYVEYQSSPEPAGEGVWDYKLIARETREGKVGEETVFDADLIFGERYGQNPIALELNAEKSAAQVINKDGTTVMNVYYDCKPYDISFSFPDSTGKKVLISDTGVKTTASLAYLWDQIEAYNTDSYTVLAPNKRFVWNNGFVEARSEMPVMRPEDQAWVLGNKGGSVLSSRHWKETLEGESPNGEEVVNNISARVKIGTVTDDRTYYLAHTSGFTAGWNGCISIYPTMFTGFTVQLEYSDGNGRTYPPTSATRPNQTWIWFHAHAQSEKNPWYYLDLNNVRLDASNNGYQYEYFATRQLAFPIYNETDGYLDVYYFRNKYHLNFHENGGEDLTDQEIWYEKALAGYEPASYVEGETEMQDEGGRCYRFAGWYTDGEFPTEAKFYFDGTMPAYDIDLFAKWEPVDYTVTFDSNGGSAVEPATGIPYGSTVSKPENPVREGYVFLGWTLEEHPYGFSSAVKEDITLVAQWRSVDAYPVRYELNGGSGTAPTDENLYYEGSGVELKDAKGVTPPAGKVFLGWTASSDGKLYYPGATAPMPTGGLTLTAQWGDQDVTTRFTYDFNFASFGIADKGLQLLAVTQLMNNERIELAEFSSLRSLPAGGYVFGGWYKDRACKDGPYTNAQIDAKNEAKNIMYARWLYPELSVVKQTTSTPANGRAYAVGETIRYKITLTNSGSIDLIRVQAVDALTGDTWTVESLPAGRSESFTASYTVTAADADAGSVTNVVTAKGVTEEDPDTPVMPKKPASVTDPCGTPASPKTGDTGNPLLWSLLMSGTALGILTAVLTGERRHRGYRRKT